MRRAALAKDENSKMTALRNLLARRIATSGPLSLAEYMAECLMHPVHGYYQKERVFGKDGDFITAPEVSQMFGEMLGLWVADRWAAMGSPRHVHLVELGPGRGTLMADMLRAASKVPGLEKSVQIHFIESSQQLRTLQQAKVPSATWHDDLSTLPEGPTIFVANEFFDALPIHQFEKKDGLWFERCVGEEGNRLAFTLTQPGAQFGLTPEQHRTAPNGSILEVCPAALTYCANLAQQIEAHGGAALIIDYGHAVSAPGDTFQALKDHRYCDPFAEPGAADLTAHVAFDRLAEVTGREVTSTIAEQGQFLMALGLGMRAQQLAAGANEAGQTRVLSELKRLTAPDAMGSLFKVLALQHKNMPPPPGF